MKSKLTLSITPQAIRHGKRVAKLRNQSLSDLITQYLEGLEIEKDASKIDPRLTDCFGAYKTPTNKDLKNLTMNSLLKKQGIKI